MNARIFYYSKTGNTKKVAEAIASELNAKPEDCTKINEKIDLSKTSLLCIGSGCYGGKAGKPLIEFVEKLCNGKGKKAVVFGTFGRNPSPLNELKKLLKEKEFNVIDCFECKGKFLFFNKGKPDKTDLEKAKNFAKKLKP